MTTICIIFIVLWGAFRLIRWALRSVGKGADSAVTLIGRHNPGAEQRIRDFWDNAVLVGRILLALAILVIALDVFF